MASFQHEIIYSSSSASRAVSIQSLLQPQEGVHQHESFVVGQRVKIIGGTYRGQMARISKLCPVKIRVILDGDGRDVCIFKSSIEVFYGSAEDGVLPPAAFTPARLPSTRAYTRVALSTAQYVIDEQIPRNTAFVAVDSVTVHSMDRVQQSLAHVEANGDISSSASASLYQRRRATTSSSRHDSMRIPVSPSAVSDIYFDAEDEEFFDARQQRDEASVVSDSVPSHRLAAHSARSTRTVLSDESIFEILNSNNIHDDDTGVRRNGGIPAVVSDDDNSSYMSVEDFDEEYDVADELEEERIPSGQLQDSPRQRIRLPQGEQPADIPGGPQFFFEMDRIIMLPPGTSKKRNAFAHHIFGDRLFEIEVPFTRSVKSLKADAFPSELSFGGCHFKLFSSKVRESGKGGRSFQQTRRVGLLYVAVSGPKFTPIDLQHELDKIAGFSLLSSRKAVARLELFQSPARKSNRKGRDFLIFDDLKSPEFEKVPELANEGCGFISRSYIERFLGSHAVGKRTFALQVRIFAPQLGIFKGVLMEKPGITKIQLPESMQKVGPSLLSGAVDWVCLVVTSAGVHPGANNVTRGNILNGKPAPKSWNGSQSKLSPMIKTLFEGLNIPPSSIKNFAAQANQGRVIEHSNLLGVADPTDELPTGHIFVTGLTELCRARSLQHLFVTRFPCTEPTDGCLLPIVTSKPVGMKSSVWEWLNGLAFGAIVFANPRSGFAPTPTTIAGGDLDGDLYFVTWNDGILSSLSNVVINNEFPLPEPTRETESRCGDHNWLKEAQHQLADVFTVLNRQALIGKLYKAWHTRVLQSDFGCDSLSFGKAFKQALDIGKHGGPVSLPRHLWQDIPQHLHKFLAE
jgi:hypothetical protein